MASDATTTAPPNKAEAEFAKYTERRAQAAAAPPSEAPASSGFPPGSLSWVVPIGMTPAAFGGPPQGGGAPGGGGDSLGGLAAGLGTTARLGVDLLNAVLVNSVKVLGGFASAYGAGHQEDCGCGGGCGCESCCEPSCCEPSCCGCESCSPGVGSCC